MFDDDLMEIEYEDYDLPVYRRGEISSATIEPPEVEEVCKCGRYCEKSGWCKKCEKDLIEPPDVEESND